MNTHFHAIVWLDHREAKIFPFDAADGEQIVLTAKAAGHHTQHKANVPGSGHHGVDREFFGRVAGALSEFGALLLTGPGHARLEFKNYLDEHHLEVAKRIKGVEPLDHPSDSELIALGHRFFRADDRVHFHGARPPAG